MKGGFFQIASLEENLSFDEENVAFKDCYYLRLAWLIQIHLLGTKKGDGERSPVSQVVFQEMQELSWR